MSPPCNIIPAPSDGSTVNVTQIKASGNEVQHPVSIFHCLPVNAAFESVSRGSYAIYIINQMWRIIHSALS
jgi:hypothetical protein